MSNKIRLQQAALNKSIFIFVFMKMIFSLVGEIGFVIIGFLWVSNKWFDSFMDLIDIVKNNACASSAELDSSNETKELPESLKHIYS